MLGHVRVDILPRSKISKDAGCSAAVQKAAACPPEALATAAGRLARLAPLHARAAVKRAMRRAGVTGLDAPGIVALALAEDPPEECGYWQHPAAPPDTTAQRVTATTTSLLASTAWRAALPALSKKARHARATHEATATVTLHNILRPQEGPEFVVTNQAEHAAGQEAAERWGGTVAELRELLDHAERLIPDLYLSAVPEDVLRTWAEMHAEVRRRVYQELGEHAVTPEARRDRCPKHHLRGLRSRANAARQHASAMLGTVGKGGSQYADGYSTARWRERQAAAQAWADGTAVTFADGTSVPLSEVMASGKRAAVSRVYAMSLGVDEWAERAGMDALFITLTLPPEYHPNPQHGGEAYDPELSPRAADRALMGYWKRLRARMDNAEIPPLGFRGVEPHQDGCPHLHALLYVPAGRGPDVDLMLQALRPEPVPGQRIATRCVPIDRARGKPTSYMMKYLVKSMNDPHAVADVLQGGAGAGDDGDGDHLRNHDRHRAWASERGLRRWAFLGVHGAQTVWQRLRTTKELPPDAPARVRDAHAAIRDRRYADALGHLGAIRADKTPRVRLAYETCADEVADPTTGELTCPALVNAYGEPVRRAAWIVVDGEEGWRMPLRRQACRLQPVQRDEAAKPQAAERIPVQVRDEVTVSVSCPRDGSEAGEDGNPRSTVGPPGQAEAAAAPATALQPRPQHSVSRTRAEWAERAANLRSRLRVTPDDIDRGAERALVASRDGLAGAMQPSEVLRFAPVLLDKGQTGAAHEYCF